MQPAQYGEKIGKQRNDTFRIRNALFDIDVKVFIWSRNHLSFVVYYSDFMRRGGGVKREQKES